MADQIQIITQPLPKDVDKKNGCLYNFTSVFPLELFPDRVILDKLKITIIKRGFLLRRRIITLPLTDTVNVRINAGPLTSQLEIADSSVKEIPVRVQHVNNNDALQFQQLVEGIVIGIRQGVNLREMGTDEIIDNAIKWGSFNVNAI